MLLKQIHEEIENAQARRSQHRRRDSGRHSPTQARRDRPCSTLPVGNGGPGTGRFVPVGVRTFALHVGSNSPRVGTRPSHAIWSGQDSAGHRVPEPEGSLGCRGPIRRSGRRPTRCAACPKPSWFAIESNSQEESIMSEPRSIMEMTKSLEEEMMNWRTHLNRFVAPILLAASGTFVFLVEKSPFYGLFLFVFTSAILIDITRDFPRTVNQLRDKENKTVRERMRLRRIEWYFFLRWRNICSFFPYWLSLSFTTFVVSMPLWS